MNLLIFFYILIFQLLILCVFTNKLLLLLRKFFLFFNFLIFIYVIGLYFIFDKTYIGIQFLFFFSWNINYNFYFSYGIDGISMLFITLIVFLTLLCYLYSWNQFKYCFKELILLLFFIEFLLINFFMSLDFFTFFFFFESILFPMFLLIGSFGSRQRKIHASLQFFLFTMIGSFFMLFSIFLIYVHEGTINFCVYYLSNFDFIIQNLVWICLFISLSVKVPLFPLHLWLPEAHVEAPTIGSVILAGVLLKMGTYGMLRFLIPIFYYSNFYFNPIVFLFCFLSIYYISIITFCQIDLKKLIAYSSISHMGFVVLGLFTFSFQGLQGSIFLMFSHGIVSSLLFFLIGMLYDRYKTRIIFFYKSLHSFMPLFSMIFFFATLANIGFPGTIGFVGEFLLMFSFLYLSKLIFIFSCLGFLTSLPYVFWLYNRISFFLPFNFFVFSDVNKREFFILISLVFFVFLIGLCPFLVFQITEVSVLKLLVFNNLVYI
jgi:NADH-quinone oxidoreductase subunit M